MSCPNRHIRGSLHIQPSLHPSPAPDRATTKCRKAPDRAIAPRGYRGRRTHERPLLFRPQTRRSESYELPSLFRDGPDPLSRAVAHQRRNRCRPSSSSQSTTTQTLTRKALCCLAPYANGTAHARASRVWSCTITFRWSTNSIQLTMHWAAKSWNSSGAVGDLRFSHPG